MANQELLQYIKQQLSLGETKDRVTKVLLDAGWTDGDVKEALEVASPSIAASKPAVSAPVVTTPKEKSAIAATSIGARSMPSGQPIANLDHAGAATSFSIKSPALGTKPMADVNPSRSPVSSSINKLDNFVASSNSAQAKAVPAQKNSTPALASVASAGQSKSRLPMIILGVLVVVLLGVSAKLYFGTADLRGQFDTLTSQNASLSSDLATAKKSAADLTAQVASLTAQNKDLDEQLSFLIIPPSTIVSSGATSTSVTTDMVIKGALSFETVNGKSSYKLTTSKYLVILLKFSTISNFEAVVKPLLGTVAEVVGTHTPGVRDMMVKSVNGTSIQ